MIPKASLRVPHTRSESDALGSLDLPSEVWFGAETQRALKNFPISQGVAPESLIRAYLQIKRATCRANAETHALTKEQCIRIERALDELEVQPASHFPLHFPIGPFQAGAGTSLHMSINEVIAARSNTLKPPQSSPLDPHDHINLNQSTNDTYPTAFYLALHTEMQAVLDETDELQKELARLARKNLKTLKAGRTHLRDAIPMRVSDQFFAYSAAIRADHKLLRAATETLHEVPLGGTAVGNGLPAPKGFAEAAIRHLSLISGISLRPCPFPLTLLQAPRGAFVLSSQLRILYGDLVRILRDLRWMASGPHTGIGELEFPKIQTGSSQMPGKSNPSAAEMLTQLALSGLGLDQTASLIFSFGELELNVMTPSWSYHLLSHLQELARGLRVFRLLALKGLQLQNDVLRRNALATDQWAVLLSEKMGYADLTEAVLNAQTAGLPLLDYLKRTGALTETELQELLRQVNQSAESSSESVKVA